LKTLGDSNPFQMALWCITFSRNPSEILGKSYGTLCINSLLFPTVL